MSGFFAKILGDLIGRFSGFIRKWTVDFWRKKEKIKAIEEKVDGELYAVKEAKKLVFMAQGAIDAFESVGAEAPDKLKEDLKDAQEILKRANATLRRGRFS